MVPNAVLFICRPVWEDLKYIVCRTGAYLFRYLYLMFVFAVMFQIPVLFKYDAVLFYDNNNTNLITLPVPTLRLNH